MLPGQEQLPEEKKSVDKKLGKPDQDSPDATAFLDGDEEQKSDAVSE